MQIGLQSVCTVGMLCQLQVPLHLDDKQRKHVLHLKDAAWLDALPPGH